MGVILLILKILGIIILFLVGLIILLILIPFFYRIHIKYTEIEQDYSFKVNTFLRFLYVVGNYDKELNLLVRILGIAVYKSGKYKKNQPNIEDDTDIENNSFEETDLLDNSMEISDNLNESQSSNIANNKVTSKKISKSSKDKISLKERIEKLKSKINKNNIEAIKYIAKCIGKFIKRIRPYIEYADCEYSLGSPDTTGMSFGAINILPGVHKQDIRICPDFSSEKLYFTGEVQFKGKIQLINIISLFVRIILNRKCRQLIFGGK